MTRSLSNVVPIKDYMPPPPPRPKSQYELHPPPFFNRWARCTWDVTPTGNYTTDCEIGNAYGIEFLNSCDGTNGWAPLLSAIVADMIRVGSASTFANGEPSVNGVVIGFMSEIGRALTRSTMRPPA